MEGCGNVSTEEEMGSREGNVIAGVLMPSKNQKMSLYQAMIRGILSQGTALVLLEAQAASGFIIDPVMNRKLRVKDALRAGVIGRDYYQKLLSAERAVTGYHDPCTGEKISLFQAMERGLIIKDHGIRLLEAQIATGGIIDPVHSHRVPVEVAYKRGYFDQEMNQILSDPSDDTKGFFDPNTQENLTYAQLLSRCVPDPDSGLLMLQLMDKGSVLFQLNEGARKALQAARVAVHVGLFQGQSVSVWELLFSRYVLEHRRQELLRNYKAGRLSVQEMIAILTTIVTETEEKSSREHGGGKSPSAKLEAGAEARSPGTDRSSREDGWEESLRGTMVDVPAGPFRGQKVSVWELLFSGEVPPERRQELLDKHRAGTLPTQELVTIVIAILSREARGSGGEQTSNGTAPGTEGAGEDGEAARVRQEWELEKALKSKTVEGPGGDFAGRKVSVWELLHSRYISEGKRQELLGQYRAGSVTLEELLRLLTVILQEAEARGSQVKFQGLRRRVTASELFSSDILDQKTLADLTQGTTTVEEIAQRDAVKRYLEGTSCIAGLLVPSKTDPSKMEKMSISQAMWKGVLRPGTGLVLLEAQAATGFIVDPLRNQKLSVDDAVAAGLVGSELHDKLLSAERAVTGYRDPYTGDQISLFQAMKKDLIVKDHGIRLLEAQIATGGIIDPVHSHRVPVEVAYKRGYFDQEMNQILSDPSDDTKGFFDPNTQENLTYAQLLSRCVPDPDTGLFLLEVRKEGF